MQDMRIQILCDQKWRDLPNVTAIKLVLEGYGHRVLVSTIKDAAAMAVAFRPDCVVFNHILSPHPQKLARSLQASNVAVVVLPTEGAMRPERRSIADGEFVDAWPADLYLAWSDASANAVRARWSLDDKAVQTIGCTRLDFYTPRFRAAVKSREAFCRDLDLDPGRPVVTWASAYGFAEVEQDKKAHAKFLQETGDKGIAECYRRAGINPALIPSTQLEGRAASAAAFAALAVARPSLQFILRPHPNENREFYRRLIADNHLTNVRFCPQGYIWDVLNTSDIHLHRHCTTAIEAWMWDKPTVEMGMDRMHQLEWPDREAASDMAQSADELIAIVDHYVGGAKVKPSMRDYRRDYIHTWFGAADGQRCAAAGRAIHEMLLARGRRRNPLSPMSVQVPARQVAASVARYALARKPNAPWGSVPSEVFDPRDKQITRSDVRDYSRLVAPAIG